MPKRHSWLIFLIPLLLLLTSGAIFVWPGFFGFGYSARPLVKPPGEEEHGVAARADLPTCGSDDPLDSEHRDGNRTTRQNLCGGRNDEEGTGTRDSLPSSKEPNGTADTPPEESDTPTSENRGRKPDRTFGGMQGRKTKGWGVRLAIAPDGKLAATGSSTQLAVWSPDSTEPMWTYEAQVVTNEVAFSPDGKTLACLHEGGLAMREASTGEVIWSNPPREEQLWALCFHDAGSHLYCAWDGGLITVVNTADGTESTGFSVPDERTIFRLYWLGTQQRLCATSSPSTLAIIDPAAPDNTQKPEIKLPLQNEIAISDDERSFVHTDFKDGKAIVRRELPGAAVLKRVKLTDVEEVERPLRLPDGNVLVQTMKGLTCALEVRDSVTLELRHSTSFDFIVGAATNGPHVVVTDFNSSVKFFRFEGQALVPVNPAKPGGIVFATWAGSSRTIITGDQSGRVSFRDADTGDEQSGFDTNSINLFRVAYSPRGDRLAYFLSDKSAWLWKPDAQEKVRLGGDTWGWSGHFFLDGSKLAVSTDGSIVTFDADTGERIEEVLKDCSSSSFAVHPDGQQLAALRGGKVRLIDLQTKSETQIEHDFGEAYTVGWSPDGATLAVCTADGALLWDVASATVRVRLTESLVTLVFDPAGNEIATCDYNGAIIRWTTSGEEIETLDGPDAPFGLEYSPDGSRLLAFGRDLDVVIWNLD